MKTKKIKNNTITIPLQVFKSATRPNKELKAAGKKAFKALIAHFKKDKWDLDYSFIVTDIFQSAYGHNLENYLLAELATSKLPLSLESKEGRLVICLDNKPRKKK